MLVAGEELPLSRRAFAYAGSGSLRARTSADLWWSVAWD